MEPPVDGKLPVERSSGPMSGPDKDEGSHVDPVRQHRLDLAARLAQGVQHSYNNTLSTASGYVELMSQRSDSADRLRSVFNQGSDLVSAFIYLVRDTGNKVRTLKVDDFLGEVALLLSTVRVGLVKFEPAWLQLSMADKHTLFYLVCELAYTLSQDGEHDVQITSSLGDDSRSQRDIVTIAIEAAAAPGEEAGTTLREKVRLACEEASFSWQVASPNRWLLHIGQGARIEVVRSRVLVAIESEVDRVSVLAQLDPEIYDVVEIADAVVALNVFEENPDVFETVVLGQASTSVNLRPVLLRMKALCPEVHTIVVSTENITTIADTTTSPVTIRQALKRPAAQSR